MRGGMTRTAAIGTIGAAVALGTVAAPMAGADGTGSARPADLVTSLPIRMAYVTNLQSANAVVWVADANGRHAQRIGHGFNAYVSPNGASVAIITPRGNNGGYAVVVRPADGGPAKTLATAKESLQFVSWAGDSEHVVAAVDNRLVVADATTGRAKTSAPAVKARRLSTRSKPPLNSLYQCAVGMTAGSAEPAAQSA